MGFVGEVTWSRDIALLRIWSWGVGSWGFGSWGVGSWAWADDSLL